MTQNATPLIWTAGRWAAAGFLLTIAGFGAGLGGMYSHAQVFAAHDSSAPVNYGADRIELQDRQNRVVLSGNVDITQAGLRLRAARTLVNYTDNGSLGIQRITATGGVQVNRGNETANGDVAVYDFGRRIITMAGNVRLRRGSDTLNGGRLVIDLQSGVSSVDGSASGSSPITGADAAIGPGGRVTGTFVVPKD